MNMCINKPGGNDLPPGIYRALCCYFFAGNGCDFAVQDADVALCIQFGFRIDNPAVINGNLINQRGWSLFLRGKGD